MSQASLEEVLSVTIEQAGAQVPVGFLVRTTRGMIKFEVSPSYIALGSERPVLSSSMTYVGDEERTQQLLRAGPMTTPGNDLHPWFSNLLPEGALRELVIRGLPTGRTSDFDVLAYLGDDLPGAVYIRPETYQPVEAGGNDLSNTPSDRIRFSLSGVQLKMSMLKQGERLTFPAQGAHGDIIAKLPSEKFPFLPEVEFTSMMLAAAVGIDVPACDLVPTSDVHGVREELLAQGDTVLAVERFDRRPDGSRVHMEDLAQLMGVPAQRKYTGLNEESILRIVTRMAGGTDPFLEGARRIACNVLLGNGDAHMKNWSLWYPDPAIAALSPAYDIVATYVYDRSNEMALRFRKTHDSTIIDLARFERAAAYCDIPEKIIRREIRNVVEKAADEWPGMLNELPMPEKYGSALIERTHTLALVRNQNATFARAGSSPGGISTTQRPGR